MSIARALEAMVLVLLLLFVCLRPINAEMHSLLRALALVAPAAGADAGELQGGEEAVVHNLPPFFDYDCDLVDTNRSSAINWNDVFAWVEDTIVQQGGLTESQFGFPETYRYLVEGDLAPTAEQECPLGFLYLMVLAFYDAFIYGDIAKDEQLNMMARVQDLLRSFPVYAIALSRWPIFYALEHFAPVHEERSESFCQGLGDGAVLDWSLLREQSLRWSEMKRQKTVDIGLETLEREIADKFFTILRRPATQQQAQDECEFGFYFLVANQVVAAASRETQHLPPFNKVIDTVISTVHFTTLASSGWPIFAILVIYADLNKGYWFFGGDRKYLRGYSDWNLRSDELSPLVSRKAGFLSPQWKEEAAHCAGYLAGISGLAYNSEVRARAIRRESSDGEPMRPIVSNIIDAGLAIAAANDDATAAGKQPGNTRRLTYLVLLYGEKWSLILEHMVQRLGQLDIAHPLLVIAIGEHAAATCRTLASRTASDQAKQPRVVCWTPASQSQVHRFTATHAMLHMGIDVLYMDMDTYLVRDPAPRVLQDAELAQGDRQLEALFARHADADCINIGVFYLRATARTAIWMSQYLAWYHDHPFEIDQRGLHVFLRIPSKQMGIAYRPEDLEEVAAGVLDDVNEVAIGDVGWYGSLSRLLIFHWCHRPLVQKEAEIGAAYDAGDAVAPHSLPLAVALSVAKAAPAASPWEKVMEFRNILEAYQKPEPPARTPCW